MQASRFVAQHITTRTHAPNSSSTSGLPSWLATRECASIHACPNAVSSGTLRHCVEEGGRVGGGGGSEGRAVHMGLLLLAQGSHSAIQPSRTHVVGPQVHPPIVDGGVGMVGAEVLHRRRHSGQAAGTARREPVRRQWPYGCISRQRAPALSARPICCRRAGSPLPQGRPLRRIPPRQWSPSGWGRLTASRGRGRQERAQEGSAGRRRGAAPTAASPCRRRPLLPLP